MKTRTLMVHSLHLFALAVLGYFVWQGLRRDGEDRLFESIKVTHSFAREQLEEDCEARLGFVQRNADAYFNDQNERFLGRAMFTNRLCDSAIQLVNDERLLLLAIDHPLSLLKDSLRASVNDDPYFTAQFDALLLPSAAPDFIKLLSNARAAQQTMFRNDLKINILLAKAQALNYFL